MPKLAKRMTAMLAKAPPAKKPLPVSEAVAILKTFNTTKFDQTVEIAMRLGIDPKQADQLVRGSIVLPHGIGKSLRVVVFAKGDKVDEAKAAGADEVGGPELAEKIKGGWTDFDVCIAAPDMMGVVGPLGKVLGPRGLMPSPRAGTVTPDVAKVSQGVQGRQGRVPQRRRRQRPRRGGQAELRRAETGREHLRLHQSRVRPEAGRGQGTVHQGDRHQRHDEPERANRGLRRSVSAVATQRNRDR